MIFKKFIGALTALVMTMTAFVGLATEVGAFSTDSSEGQFSLLLKLDNDNAFNIYTDDANEYINFLQVGHSFKYDDKNYITTSLDVRTEPITVIANAVPTLTVAVGEGGTVHIGNNTFNGGHNEEYTAVAGTTLTVSIVAVSGYYIDSVTLNGESVDGDYVNQNTAVLNVEMPNDSATLSVTFVTTYEINVVQPTNGTVSVNQTTAKANDTITVYPVPTGDYEVESVKYSYTGSGDTTQTASASANSDGSYSFDMPAADVTVTVTFRERVTLPNAKEADFVREYDDPESPTATLWEGTLNGYGNTSFKPSITVTLNAADEEAAQQKTVIGSTTVTGDSSIYLAIVVDQAKSAIDSVMLRGVTEDTDPTGGIYIDQSQSESDDSGEEVD